MNKNTKMTPSERPFKRVWISLFMVTSLIIVIIGYLQFQTENERVEQDTLKDLVAVAKLKANQLAVWRKDRLGETLRFSQGPSLISSLRDFLKDPNNPDATARLRFMLTLNRKGDFYQNAMVVSPSGQILMSAEPVYEAPQETTRQAMRKALDTRSPAFSAMYRCVKNQIHIDVVAPVCETNGVPLALFVIRSNAESFIYPLIRFWPTESSSAKTVLVGREGNEAIILNRFEPGSDASALSMRFPLLHDTQSTIPQAALGFQGVFRGKDHMGRAVVADIRPIADSDWALVNQIDQKEIRSELYRRAESIVTFAGLIIFLAAALMVTGYRRRQSQIYRDLYRIEREQREAQERFGTILYSIGDGVIVCDRQGRICQINPVAEQLTGWKETDCIGKPLEDVFRIINEDTREKVENPANKVLKNGKVAGLANHTLLIARDGTERPIADSGAPVRDGQGEITGVVLVFRDQTVEHAAQCALQRSEAQYSDLFNNMTEGCALHEIICDLGGKPIDYRFLKVNPAFERLTGLSAERILGRCIRDVLPETEDHWIEAYGRVALEGLPIEFEQYSAALKRHFHVAAFRPRPGCFCTLFSDITETKKNAEERKTLELRLQQSQRIEALGRLAGGMAHDFNNMLAVIIGTSELAKEHLDVSEPLYNDLTQIIQAGSRSAELVRQLLAFASRQTISPRVINLNETVANMLGMLKRLVPEDMILEWHPGESLWSSKLDPSQIDQILVNLTANARDAIRGKGTISIRTENITLANPADASISEIPLGDYIMISVCDSGCGMDLNTQAHIFEPFFTTKHQGLGAGLGLSTVYGIIKQNNGAICVSSAPGKGSRFDIYLPRYEEELKKSETPAQANTTAALETAKTILLVEDEPALLTLTHAIIKKLGYTTLTAGDPQTALQKADTYTGIIDLLVTDVVMPKMSGHELWQNLSKKRPQLKCLYISGYTADIIADRGIIDSSIHFLQKPFSREALAAQLREIFSSE